MNNYERLTSSLATGPYPPASKPEVRDQGEGLSTASD